ncbi:branched-chain amino acid ABC transporter permease [Chthonobacter rhizosphaerae]|uniref:branched-chain amino acid ABC transporter permease n=1 Tax=Chthonobacter rhizosphaerae TaxID=2735553 RepID=UPI0031B5A44D
MRRSGPLLALSAALLLAAGCDRLDDGQARLCTAVVPALEETGRIRVDAVAPDPERATVVRVAYTVEADGGERRPGFVRCAFGGGFLDRDRLTLVAVESAEGRLTGARLLMLNRFWLGDPDALAEGERRLDLTSVETPILPAPVSVTTGYALQQVLNALPVAAVYGFLAAAYALVYGLLGRINLAFGCFAVAGGFAAAGVVTSYDRAWTMGDPVVATMALAAAVTVAGAQGALIGTLTGSAVFRPLARAGGTAFLIATIGLALVLSEGLRLVAGSGERWIQPVLATPILVAGGDYRVTVTTLQVLQTVLAAAVLTGLARAMARSRFGRDWRAMADDPLMASLVGIDRERTAALAFALSGLLAGIAGAADTLHYGHASAAAWLTLSLKALMAAVLGGLGSVRGAILGGVLLGFAETAWASLLPMAHREVAVMTGLVLLLVFRPDGLLGVSRPAADSGDARWRSADR